MRSILNRVGIALLVASTVASGKPLNAQSTSGDSASDGTKSIGADQSRGAAKVSGIDLSLFSETISPGENFYLYANEKWLNETDIPADKSNYGIFTVLDDETREKVRALIEQAAAEVAEAGTPSQKVGDLYQSVLDVDARNTAGLKPIEPLLEKIRAIETQTDLARTLGELRRAGLGGPFVPYVSVDAKNSDQYTVYLTQSGLSLPDRDYYLEDEERYVELRTTLRKYIADLLKQVDHADPEAAANSIYEIESRIATLHWTKTENRDPVATYNPVTPSELDLMLGEMKWFDFAKAAQIESQSTIVVRQPTYLEGLADIFENVSIDQWKDYLTYHTIDGFASGLSESLEKRHFEFHDTAISGITEQQPMWKRGVNVTGSVLGELVGQLYVEKHFKPIAKKRMNELVENLIRAFEGRIKTRDWMGEGTKKQALEKLSKFTTKIGYPDEWKDYDALTIGDGVLADHLLASSRFEYQRDIDKLGGPIDRNEWHMTPQTINAYYNPTMNEIVFPAAILQPPFFNLAADDAVNYGGIGAVIGHELSHGFDDKGSKFDGNGNLRMWWTEEDRLEFERRAKGLVEQYNSYEPIAGRTVNGELTLGENIGDLGGLSVAYAAYKLSLDGKEAPVIDGLTGDQRFFLGWSQIWRRKYRDAEMVRRLSVDPHSPSEFRVIGIVRNMDAWYEAFGITDKDNLYLAPEERVRIW
ncbi:M13 family metallopeptidase [Roseiconus lacunae]|uniref:M13 family metallopeptidase n=1 Tax=Roseiconus lacunae TaxID=2605694 RepID=UPI001E3F165C|nr:M13-type metalloendopeptidase [Roseiconus lacunae]MCD0459054.1 peptidase M13 [Roseiconus lacunae]